MERGTISELPEYHDEHLCRRLTTGTAKVVLSREGVVRLTRQRGQPHRYGHCDGGLHSGGHLFTHHVDVVGECSHLEEKLICVSGTHKAFGSTQVDLNGRRDMCVFVPPPASQDGWMARQIVGKAGRPVRQRHGLR